MTRIHNIIIRCQISKSTQSLYSTLEMHHLTVYRNYNTL